MIAANHSSRNYICALAACIFFVAAGLPFPAHLGVQNDEALFGQDLYEPHGGLYTVMIGHTHFRPMLMSYLGTLKAWLYRPIFRVFGVNPQVLRVPVLLAGCATIWLFYRLLLSIAGQRAALIGCGILATDPIYLLTTCFDWGPVALQHLLVVGGMLLLVRLYQTRRSHLAFWAFLLFGLAMWDKALAVWMLSALGIATLVAFPRQLLASLSVKRVLLALLGFGLGALPLIWYNVNNQYPTFTTNIQRDTADIPGKFRLLLETPGGHGMFSWMINEEWQTPVPHQPRGVLQTVNAGIARAARHPRHWLMPYAFLLALVAAPFAKGARRTVLFGLMTIAVAWIQMATTANAGGSLHHTILLWPMPALVIAVSLAAVSRRLGNAGRPALAALLVLVMLSGGLVINEYYYMMIRCGGSSTWSDAIYNLTDHLTTVKARNLWCMDWGMLDSLRLLSRGKLPVRVGVEQIGKPELNDPDRELARKMIGEGDSLFVAHTKDMEVFTGMNDKLLKFAAGYGYAPQVLATIPDTYGRPTFAIYRFIGPQ